ncbi:MAG: hypothetical protein H6581_28115 [Bacteroidia bacterium]|nr:hypothetical protein [Bacteroidia bacterium]
MIQNFKTYKTSIKDSTIKDMCDSVEMTKVSVPNPVQLTPIDRRSIPNVSDSRMAFAIKAEDYTHQFPSVISEVMRIPEAADNLKGFMGLEKVIRRTEVMLEILKDTSMVASAAAFHSYRCFYDALVAAAEAGLPGADEAAADLGKLYRKATGGKSLKDQDTVVDNGSSDQDAA